MTILKIVQGDVEQAVRDLALANAQLRVEQAGLIRLVGELETELALARSGGEAVETPVEPEVVD